VRTVPFSSPSNLGMHELAGLRAGVHALPYHLHAVDENVHDTRRELTRLVEGGMVGNRRRIEDDDVRVANGSRQPLSGV